MGLGQASLRLFAVIAVVALPGLAALALVLAYADAWIAEVGFATAFLLIGLATLAWGALVASLTARAASRDLQEVVSIATRGGGTDGPEAATDDLGAVQRQLRSALDERNRQIATLAADVAAAPITGGPVEVAARVVEVARQVTGDPTWLLVVLHAADPTALPAGVYDADPATPARAVDELEQWAAVTGEPERLQPRHLIGPWGAVVVVDVSSPEELTGLLLAPWEGRPEPSPAERNLLSLIAQVAASALEHSLLYARLQAQTDELNRLAAVQSDFLRGITHDLQTPLTSIRALAADIGQEAKLNAQARSDLEAIGHQADRLRRMVGQLLAVSRLEAGALESRQEIFRAEPIVRRTWDALRNTSHQLEFDADGEPHLVVGDPDRFEQVLWALFDNAVKYSPAGTQIRVRLTGRDGPNWRPRQPADGDRCRAGDRGRGSRAGLRPVLSRRARTADGARRQRHRSVRRSRPGRGHAWPLDPLRRAGRRGDLHDHPPGASPPSPRRTEKRPGNAPQRGCRAESPSPEAYPRYYPLSGGLQGAARDTPGMNRLRRRMRRSSRGQGLVEFALIVPVLLLIILLGLDFGRVFFGWVGLTNASRIGASYAAAHPTAWGSPGSATERDSYEAQILADAAALNCTLPGTLPDPAFAAGTDLGDTAQVTLSCTFTLLTPVVSQLLGNTITIQADTVFPIRAGLAGTTPLSSPVPTPSPSPSPTATPDPSATPAPTPVPCQIPSFVGAKVNDAQSIWFAAGFTTTVTVTRPPNGNYTITNQSTVGGQPANCNTTQHDGVRDMSRLATRSAKGQSLVEFALVFPVFILLLIGLFDLGRAVFAFNTVSNASRESVRIAIVNQTEADIEAEALKQGVGLGLTPAEVTISYGDPSGTGDCTAPFGVTCRAAVTVQYTFVAATPVIGQIIGPFTISSTTEMPVERTCPDSNNPSLLTCPWP